MFLRDTAAISSRIAIVNEEEDRYTYGELDELSSEYGAKIPTRSLVLILSDHSIETVAFYYCQMVNHVVPILIDRNLNEELLSRIIKSYEPQFIWCEWKDRDKLRGFISKKIFQRGDYAVLQTAYSNIKIGRAHV